MVLQFVPPSRPCLRMTVPFVIAAFLAARPSPAERPNDTAIISQIETQLRADIGHLASDELRGRGVTDDTIDQAARYVADRMNEIGLNTDVIDGEPFQAVDIEVGAQAGTEENNFATFRFDESAPRGNKNPITVKLADGMNPLAIGADTGTVNGRVAFVGYGISAPKLGKGGKLSYDDYAGIDVKGATVIMLRKEPGMNDPNSPFDGKKTTRYAYFASKVKTALDRGATGIIIVNDSDSILQSVQKHRSKIVQEQQRRQRIVEALEKLPSEAENTRETLAQKQLNAERMIQSLQDDLQTVQRGLLGVSEAGEQTIKDAPPVICLARDTAEALISLSTGKSLDTVVSEIDRSTKPNSFVLPGVQASWQVELKPSIARSSNVIGVLPGQGRLADETVVIGAHYDHVGMGGYGSLAPGTVAVHNGADDNASGTATMLAAASQLKNLLEDFADYRRIVFIAFTGEERGLLGSKAYVNDPSFPVESTIAMINLDMVGRLRDNELTLYGTGSANGLDEIIDRSNARFQFDVFKVKTGYGPSDHQSFYKAGIPVLFFFTGLHNDYHRPSDDADKIEYRSTARISQMVADVAHRLAVRPDPPQYAETENRVRIRRQLTAYIGVSLSDRGTHVVFSSVNDGGPAEKAGLRTGDQLDLLDKKKIRQSREVLDFLRGRSPGQVLKVRVFRNGKPIEVNVKLGKRPLG